MAKRRTAIARRSGGRIKRSRRGSTSTRGFLPVVGALGVAGIIVANDWVGTGNSPLGWALAGNFNNALYSLGKNLTSVAVIASLVPALIVVWLLLKLHSKFGRSTRIGHKWGII